MTNRIEQLLSVLESIDGPISRPKIEQKRKQLQQIKKAREANPPDDSSGSQDGADDSFDSLSSPTVVGDQANQPVSVVFATLDKGDMSRFSKDYVHGGEPRCFAIGRMMTSDTLLVITTRVGHLAIIGAKLHFWGFKQLSRVFLCQSPDEPDVTQAPVVVVCAKNLDLFNPLSSWLSGDANELCLDLLREVPGRRVHLFAKSATSGWEVYSGESNWTTEFAS
jgi:hypothetical protein